MFIQNFCPEDDVEVVVIDLDNDSENIISSINCYGILGDVINDYIYSIFPYYSRQTIVKCKVTDYGLYPELILKKEFITVNNFDIINGEGKILSYKRIVGENWNFDRDGFVYDNGNSILNEQMEMIYKCYNCGYVGIQSEFISDRCPNCNSDRIEEYEYQEKFKISPIPICKIPYVN